MKSAIRSPGAGLDHDRMNCPVEGTLALLSGKWRLMVLFRLGASQMRFNALARSLEPVSLKVLAETLRGLEADGLVWRRVDQAVPPAVTYGLTARGAALEPVFAAMARWKLAGDVESKSQPPESVFRPAPPTS